jgi:hypothetical protein
MKRLWMSGAAAVMAISIAGVGAQTPQDPPTQPPQTQPPATTPMQDAPVTLQGCVYKEADIPGRTPNIAEKAGVLEDYILVASSGSSAAGTPTGTSGSMAPTKLYKLEKIADEKLKLVVGKRVEVTGRVDAERSDTATGTAGAPARDKSAGPDQIELPEFEVTTIREVEGTCPATPEIRK